MSKNPIVNRRKPRPEASKPGFFTGKNPNFVAKALAAPFNLLGHYALAPKNMMELHDPENMGNRRHPSFWSGRKHHDGEIPVKGGMAPVRTTITPRPKYHYFDLLDGGKGTAHMIDIKQEIDLRNIRPEKGAEAMAKIEQKAKNDAKISGAALEPINKDTMQATMGPSSYRAAYYNPYPKQL